VVEFKSIPCQDKPKFYAELAGELRGMYESYWFTNLANASGALMAHIPDLNWAGFYLFQDGELRLGPFQGLPACLRIGLGKGVCGTAAVKRKPVLVEDVAKFPGHIACDSRSRSELVVPLLHNERLLGVLDLDSPRVGRFDLQDQNGISTIAAQLISATVWPENFGSAL